MVHSSKAGSKASPQQAAASSSNNLSSGSGNANTSGSGSGNEELDVEESEMTPASSENSSLSSTPLDESLADVLNATPRATSDAATSSSFIYGK